MAITVQTKLTGDLSGALAKFERAVQEKVLISGAAAMAKVLYDQVKLNTLPPNLYRRTGNLHDSIYRVYAEDRSSETSKSYQISWNKRTAPHGHLLEFGTSRAPAHPFIRPAFDYVGEAIKAGQARMAQRLNEGVT